MIIKKFVSASGSSLLIQLICQDGFSLTLSSLGASIRQILCPVGSSRLQNIALSFSEEEDWRSNSLYAGATLAPTAGRISKGLLPLKNGICQLSRNENNCHSLHGGFHNASFQNWELLSAEQTDSCVCVTFTLTLPDGLDGFPGNRQLRAIYTLAEQHVLTLRYEALSDRETYFNLSNHCYFNLSGDFSRSAKDHILKIRAGRCLVNAPDFIPEGSQNVTDTPFDFRQPTSLKEQQDRFPGDDQLLRNQGYNHGFILDHRSLRSCDAPSSEMPESTKADLICTLPGSPVTLSISSDAPCMVLYSGGYIPEGLALAGGQYSVPSCALAFEFQDYPDAPGSHGFPYETTPSGTLWNRTIAYRFEY